MIAKSPGNQTLSVPLGNGTLQPWVFAADTLPEISESDVRDPTLELQLVTVPVIVNGTISQPGETDWFRLEGRAGETLVVETLARRLGSPLDSLVAVLDDRGRQLALNDDHADPASGRLTHHADSHLILRIPADGRHRVHVKDVQQGGGVEHGYRLRLSAERPDFELRVVPSTINANAGTTVPLTVHAVRRDGYQGDIALELNDPPPGFVLGGGWVPAGQDQVRLTLTVPSAPSLEPFRLELIGRAKITGAEVVRGATPDSN